jgi:hypothetical protein
MEIGRTERISWKPMEWKELRWKEEGEKVVESNVKGKQGNVNRIRGGNVSRKKGVERDDDKKLQSA